MVTVRAALHPNKETQRTLKTCLILTRTLTPNVGGKYNTEDKTKHGKKLV